MNFRMQPTKSTPEVVLTEGKLEMKGRSIPEHSTGLYEPLLEALGSYAQQPPQYSRLDFRLEYANSSTKRCLMQICNTFEGIYKGGRQVEVNWFVENDDESMAELGRDLASMVSLPFRIIES